MDAFALDSDGEIWSWVEAGKVKNIPVFAMTGNAKTPVPQGQTGVDMAGANCGIRTHDLCFTNQPYRIGNVRQEKQLQRTQNAVVMPVDSFAA
ncbi:MAG: hypothetical protein LBS30_02765 [Planctomycetota bacterium]|nr:hypothetical protein [Planctomycetota bacterium]